VVDALGYFETNSPALTLLETALLRLDVAEVLDELRSSRVLEYHRKYQEQMMGEEEV
jgi:hypothetical protein